MPHHPCTQLASPGRRLTLCRRGYDVPTTEIMLNVMSSTLLALIIVSGESDRMGDNLGHRAVMFSGICTNIGSS